MSWPLNNWSPNYNGKRSLGPLSMTKALKPNAATQVTPQIQDNNAIFAAAQKAQANDPTALLDPKLAAARHALRATEPETPQGKVPAAPSDGAAKHAPDSRKVLIGTKSALEGEEAPSRLGVRQHSLPSIPAKGREPVKTAGALSFLQPLARKIPKDWLTGDRSAQDILSDAIVDWSGKYMLPGNMFMKTPGDFYLRTPQFLRDMHARAVRQRFYRPGPRITEFPRLRTFEPSHAEAFGFSKLGVDKRAVLEPIWGGMGGAYVAPKTKRLEGALRGVGVGTMSALGGLGTGALGYQLAKGRNLGTTRIAGYDIPNEVLVGLASSLPGNALGYLAGKEMFWPKRWEDPKERVKEDVAGLIGLRQGG